ncbi:MAG TPA: NADH-quinone oxidoreductase subunit J [Micromonosporaceae bacterium]|jgi:NADH-quinone oxidoreductase subunit J
MTVLAASAAHVSTGEAWVFWILTPIALLGAVGMVWARNAIHSALFLVLTMLSLGVFYIVQAGPFIGLVQIIVYTGAIMMLFLFVLMLVGRDASDSVIETLRGQRVAAVLLGLGLAILLCTGIYRALEHEPAPATALTTTNAANSGNGNVNGIAQLLFTKYIFAFEVTSALLITAALGAMVLAHVQKSKEEKLSQPEMMRKRFAPGSYPAPKPGPGVYALSDSVATPAILPDGALSERSTSPILPTRELTAEEAAPKPTLTGGSHDA